MKNSFYIGFFAGLVVCGTAYLLTHYTAVTQQFMPSKPTGLYVIAVAINFIGVWSAYRQGYDNIGKGLVFVSFVALVLAVFTKEIVI